MIRLTVMFLALLFLNSCLSKRVAQKNFKLVEARRDTFDAIIVPGMEMKKNAWSILMKRRVLWACELYHKGLARNVIFSGGAVYSPYYESYVMALYAERLGIPPEHMFFDTVAKHSIENVYYSYLIAQQHGFDKIALCTDRFQTGFLKRAVKRRFATEVVMLPVVVDSIEKYKHLEPDVNMELAKMEHPEGFRSIRDAQGGIQRLRGTLGMKIPWHKYPDGRVPEIIPISESQKISTR